MPDAVSKHACFAGALLLCAVVCIGCGGRPAETGASASRLPFGVVDLPHSGETLRGTTRLGGWALSEDSIERVALYVDRNYVVAATLGGARPDVAKSNAAISDAAASGWNVLLDTTAFPEGPHEIVVQARSRLGATRDIGTLAVSFAR